MRFRSVIIAGLLVGVMVLVFFAGRTGRESPEVVVQSPTNSRVIARSTFRKAARQAAVESFEAGPSVTASNHFQRLAAGELDLQLDREQLAEYLRQFGTNAETLLATQDKDYIRLAAELFPNDPRVQYAVITRDIFPEAKREWLDRFKQSAPDNAMANYLSAREHLKAGDREQGLQDLADAATKTHFNDYTTEQVQNMEDAQLSAGRSLVEAKMAAGSELLLPQLAMFKSLAQEVQAMQKEYLAAGDPASAETLARLGHQLAHHLAEGEGSRTLIGQLVGVAIDRIVLSSLPQDGQPAFLDGTIQQRLDELNAVRQNIRTLTGGIDEMMGRATDNEIIGYFDRLKLQGEYQAMLWLRNRNNLR